MANYKGQKRSTRKGSKSRVRHMQRMKDAWTLKIEGLTNTQIAEKLGVARCTVSALVNEEYKKIHISLQEDIAQHKQMLLERHEDLYNIFIKKARKGKLGAAQFCDRTLVNMARLYGLYQQTIIAPVMADVVRIEMPDSGDEQNVIIDANFDDEQPSISGLLETKKEG